jgi:alkylation response protein AidB-like acyl-CoA dehydrogenase
VLAHGTEEQKAEHVAATLRGQQTWCQLFSEPGAGSDLASLATKARRDGDAWVVDGQKVWTSFAEHADHGILLARTRADGPRHAGITMFIVPMDLDGIDVRPLKEMTGGTHFSEVFLNGVRLPLDAVLGDEGAGWKVAMTTLGSERTAGGFDRASRSHALIRQVRALGRELDPLVRDQLARLWSLERMQGILGERVQAEADAGRPPVWGGSVLKLGHARIEQTAARTAVLLGGPDAVAWDPDDAQGPRLAFELLYSRMWSIAGGSDEIQRNILAERALGLPKEPK